MLPIKFNYFMGNDILILQIPQLCFSDFIFKTKQKLILILWKILFSFKKKYEIKILPNTSKCIHEFGTFIL